MPTIKNWQGAGTMEPASDPMAKPTAGEVVEGSQPGWNSGGLSERPNPDPTAPVPGQAKIPSGGKA